MTQQQYDKPSIPRRLWPRVRWLAQPVLILAATAMAIVLLGLAQRAGWIKTAQNHQQEEVSSSDDQADSKETLYICPMMCTEPLSEPGDCPACGMPLVKSSQDAGATDGRSIQIDPAARRVANIQMAEVEAIAAARQIRVVGQLHYDEGRQKTLASYVDGRIDRLYADYTGVVVRKGDDLALVYSPELFTAQSELLAAERSVTNSSNSGYRSLRAMPNLAESAMQKLLDLGMTEQQIAELRESGQPSTRIELVAPIDGTVTAKLVAEGEYVKRGQPIYRLADLSTVWLMLELFPEQAAAIRYGQQVEAEVQSLPGEEFVGRVAFVDPMVDPETRTIGVRVVIPNRDGRLRVGDYATATIEVPLVAPADSSPDRYDPELAGKWISPRHPHVIEETPGKCRICGIELVPSSEFGYVTEPPAQQEQIVVPRNAVLMAGENSVVYVEVETGRFALQPVELGPSLGDRIVILEGLEPGNLVATHGNFLIDSQMQLAGNPSLIDPTRATAKPPEKPLSPEVVAALSKLSDADRELAERQRICPVSEEPLGSMGKPIKVDVQGHPVFICCEGCRGMLLKEPDKYFAKLPEEARP